jgi:hypothetical protein
VQEVVKGHPRKGKDVIIIGINRVGITTLEFRQGTKDGYLQQRAVRGGWPIWQDFGTADSVVQGLNPSRWQSTRTISRKSPRTICCTYDFPYDTNRLLFLLKLDTI